MTKKILVFISDGVEEIEFVSTVDILRRAGADVKIAVVGSSLMVVGQNQIKIEGNIMLQEVSGQFDMIVLPGGGQNSSTLGSNKQVVEMLHSAKKSGTFIAAICASPVLVLEKNGLLEDIDFAVSYPTMMEDLQRPHPEKPHIYNHKKIITSQGPGTSIKFALHLVEVLFNKEIARNLAHGLVATEQFHVTN